MKFARARGIEDGGPADRLLGSWLDHRPAEEMFANATSLIRAMLEARGPDGPAADDLVRQSEAVAAASGGLFGINRVSGEERQLLARIAEELKHHR